MLFITLITCLSQGSQNSQEVLLNSTENTLEGLVLYIYASKLKKKKQD